MNIIGTQWARSATLIACVVGISACDMLPAPGPTKSNIYSGSVQKEGDAFIVAVNDNVTRATAVIPAVGFSSDFVNAGVVGPDTIRPGDVLSISIWENVEEGILTTATGPAVLNEVQVDGAGFIFVPYAGRIQASGNSPEAIRRIITQKLEQQTPDPQVLVSRLSGDGATVSITGAAGSQGVFPIERPTRKLGAMRASAGGVKVPLESAVVKIIRGNRTGQIWYQDLFENPHLDIALRDGDRILVEADTRAFTVLGATGSQTRVKFETQTLSAIEALAQVGGLNPTQADPTGIFVFRNEPAEIAAQVLGRYDLVGDQRLVYVLDLTEPNGMFMARDFMIRDDDTVYVTEAPYVQWSKLITAITTTAGAANAVGTLANRAGLIND